LNRLSLATLDQLPGSVGRPAYDVANIGIAIVHFGPGAFFRAHQAAYYDALLAQDVRWGVSAVSLHSVGVRDALTPQDGLYGLAILDAEPRLQVIGAVREVLVAPTSPAEVLARLASPSVRLVTLTVTEKGYGLDASGALNVSDPAVAHDLKVADAAPKSVIGWLCAGLKARRAAGLPPFVTLSCDNLTDNGGKLRRAVIAFAKASGQADLADWIETTARFPSSMVDSITPATDDALRAKVAAELGLEDAWPIQREAFSQWVIEDALGPDGPDLASVGATLTTDVSLFERAKLRLLNGPHSSLAYLGLLAGLTTVSEAIAEPRLKAFIARLMRDDIAPSLDPDAGLDLDAYCAAILSRFANPALRHELAQIAWDGSKKLPFRLLGTVSDAYAAGRSVERLAIPIAAWMLFVRAHLAKGLTLVDPLAPVLADCVSGAVDEDVDRFFGATDMFAQLGEKTDDFREAVAAAHTRLSYDPLEAIR
jgi:fructuronate reductase